MAEVKISRAEQYRALFQIRSLIFWRSMRNFDNRLTLVLTIILRLLMLCGALGVATGAGFAMYFGLTATFATGSHSDPHKPAELTLWGVFAAWQVIVLLRASLSHSVGRELLRFPIRFGTYVTLWTISGLTDYTTMFGALACVGIAIGAEAAGVPVLFALLVPFVFFLMNMALSRALFIWLERLLAHRRTREFILVVLSLLGILPQTINMYMRESHAHMPLWLVKFFSWFPPVFAFHALQLENSFSSRTASLLVLVAITALLIALIGYRLLQEYRGEDLHEAVAGVPNQQKQQVRAARRESESASKSVPLAVLGNEFAKLKHSGMASYQVVAPLLFIVIFGVRLARHAPQWLLPGGMIYLTFALLGAYNSLGTDGPGFQLYRMAPVRLRDVFLGKNLYTLTLFALQTVALIAITTVLHGMTIYGLIFALAVGAFAASLHLSIANKVSLRLATRTDNIGTTMKAVRASGGRRGGNAGGWRGLLGMLSAIALPIGLLALGVWLQLAWLAPLCMTVIAGIAVSIYFRRLDQVDQFKPEDMERALAALTKT